MAKSTLSIISNDGIFVVEFVAGTERFRDSARSGDLTASIRYVGPGNTLVLQLGVAGVELSELYLFKRDVEEGDISRLIISAGEVVDVKLAVDMAREFGYEPEKAFLHDRKEIFGSYRELYSGIHVRGKELMVRRSLSPDELVKRIYENAHFVTSKHHPNLVDVMLGDRRVLTVGASDSPKDAIANMAYWKLYKHGRNLQVDRCIEIAAPDLGLAIKQLRHYNVVLANMFEVLLEDGDTECIGKAALAFVKSVDVESYGDEAQLVDYIYMLTNR